MKVEKLFHFNFKKTTLALIPLLAALGRGSSWSICVQGYNNYVYFTFLLSLVSFCIINKGKIPVACFKNNCSPLILLVFLLPSFIFVDPAENFGNNISLIASVLAVYFITLIYDRNNLIESFIQIMYFFAIVSLICYTLFAVMRLPYSWMPLLQKNNDTLEQFRSIIIYSIRLNDADRNCGPFWEPSIFSIYLIIAAQLESFVLKRKSKKKIAVFIATIITTFSTGGYAFVAVYFMMWIWQDRKYSLLALLISITVVIMLWVSMDYVRESLLSINYDLFSKIFNFTSNKSSMSRVYSIMTNIEIWKTNIILGVGQAKVNNIYLATSRRLVAAVLEMNPSQSATPFIFTASFGVGGLYYSWLWIKGVLNCDTLNNVQKILFGIGLFMMLIEVPHLHFMLTYYVLFALLKNDFTKQTNS